MEYIRDALYDEIASNSNVISGEEYRELICAVSQVASDMVVKTLGPYGSTTVIDDGTGFTYPSKDGWSCLNKLQFTDPTYNSIFTMLKKISFNSVTTVGDGTTTAMVAANNFLRQMYIDFIPKVKDTGFRQADFIDTMNETYEKLENALRTNPNVQRVDPEGDFSDIYKIAYIATNGNSEFARIIQNIYKETGNPNIQVTMDKDASTTYEIQKGYKFDARTLNFAAYVNCDARIIDYTSHPCKIVIFDHNVTFQMHEKILGGLSGLAARDNFEIIIMAPYFDDIVTSWIDSNVQRMVQNRQIPNIMLIQIPLTAAIQRTTISDLCVLTNAQVFDEAKVKAFNILFHNKTHPADEQIEDSMFSLEEYSFESPEEILHRCLGTIKSIIITKTEGFLQDYDDIANPVKYAEIINEAKNNYNLMKTKAMKTIGGTLDKDYLYTQMRYIKLKGSTGVIKVGAFSDIQQRCDKDALDDAVLACRSAYENGYVRGMNAEILSILYEWMNSADKNPVTGIYANEIEEMLYKCFYLTSLQVLMNKQPNNDTPRRVTILDSETPEGLKPLDVATYSMNNVSILEMIIRDPGYLDYNLRTEEMHRIGNWEVINSTATDIEILRAVVNVLTTVITSNQFLSVTRRYDPKVNSERSIQNRMKEDSRIINNKVNTIIDSIVSNKNFEKIQNIFDAFKYMNELSNIDPDEISIDDIIDTCDTIGKYSNGSYFARTNLKVYPEPKISSDSVYDLAMGTILDIIDKHADKNNIWLLIKTPISSGWVIAE